MLADSTQINSFNPLYYKYCEASTESLIFPASPLQRGCHHTVSPRADEKLSVFSVHYQQWGDDSLSVYLSMTSDFPGKKAKIEFLHVDHITQHQGNTGSQKVV